MTIIISKSTNGITLLVWHSVRNLKLETWNLKLETWMKNVCGLDLGFEKHWCWAIADSISILHLYDLDWNSCQDKETIKNYVTCLSVCCDLWGAVVCVCFDSQKMKKSFILLIQFLLMFRTSECSTIVETRSGPVEGFKSLYCILQIIRYNDLYCNCNFDFDLNAILV